MFVWEGRKIFPLCSDIEHYGAGSVELVGAHQWFGGNKVRASGGREQFIDIGRDGQKRLS